jgi:hypothetical protein
MLLALLALAIFEPAPELVFSPVGADLVPLCPRLPDGLPSPQAVADPVGTLLPAPRDELIGAIVGYCRDEYPALVRQAVERAKAIKDVECNGRMALTATQWKAEAVKEASKGPTWWHVASAGLIGTAIGVLGGVIVLVAAR